MRIGILVSALIIAGAIAPEVYSSEEMLLGIKMLVVYLFIHDAAELIKHLSD